MNCKGEFCRKKYTVLKASPPTHPSKVVILKPYKDFCLWLLISCGIGSVLSTPKAINPRTNMKASERPKMRYRMAWTRMNPARNSMYCVYVGHCQKANGLVEAPTFSGLPDGRYLMQIYRSASCASIMNRDCRSKASSNRLPSQKKHRVMFASSSIAQTSRENPVESLFRTIEKA